jgi:ubiquinone/menaquinone biosynthesis C-methylase UbiE
MQSIEHLVQQRIIAEESKESLKLRLKFEEYQSDFNFPNTILEQESFLDVGAGNGEFASYLQKEKGNKHAFALDTEYPSSLPFCIEGSIENLPYGDHLFDNTVARNVIHAIMLQDNNGNKTTRALQELIRVTKHGGKIYYSTHNPSTLFQKIQELHDLTEGQKEISMQHLQQGLQAEQKYLEYVSSLGHSVQELFKNGRRVVTITLRAVQ